MQDEKSKIKRIHEAKKKVLQFRTLQDAFIARMGSEKIFTNERRDQALAYSLLLDEEEKSILLLDTIIDLTDVIDFLTRTILDAVKQLDHSIGMGFNAITEVLKTVLVEKEENELKGEPKI